MAVNYSQVGTRMSLSQRFSLIRKDNQQRSIGVNPTVSTTQAPSATFKNFSGTVAHSDRPSAALGPGSDRNKRLILQMAMQPSVLNELGVYNPAYNPQIQAQIPYIPHVPQVPQQLRALQLNSPQQQQGIRQRLGQGRIQNGNNTAKKSIKSRLGVKRIPISQRIGVKPIQSDQKNLNVNNRLRARNTVPFKKKPQNGKINQFKAANKFNVKPIRKPAPRAPVRKVTAEQLDQDLEGYMRKTKGFLNADLDAYMSQI